MSDLSASAARPEALFVTLTLPGDVELERVLELYEGLAEAGVPVRGGDTSSAGRIVVSLTALGRSDQASLAALEHGRGGRLRDRARGIAEIQIDV